VHQGYLPAGFVTLIYVKISLMELCLDFLLLMNLINFLLSTQFIDELRSVGVWVQVLRRIRLSRFCECMLDFHVDPGQTTSFAGGGPVWLHRYEPAGL